MTKKPMAFKAWAAFHKGRLHVSFDGYKYFNVSQRKTDLAMTFDDVRPVLITPITRKKK